MTRFMVSSPMTCSPSLARLGLSRIGDDRRGRHVDAAMSLQQTLMRGRQEREAGQEVLVVHFHPLGQTGSRVARGDEADQHRGDVDLMFVWRRAAAEAP